MEKWEIPTRTQNNGIVRMGKVMQFQSYKPSKLRDMENFTARDICDLAREGEEMALDILWIASASTWSGP